MRRSFVFAAVAAVVSTLSLTLGARAALAQGAARQQVIPEGQSASPTLTPGIRVGNMIYASGQLGMSRTAPDTTIQGQTRVALESTKKVFEAAGTTMANAVKCTVFLIDVKDFAGMNSVYREFFPVAPPARSTVVVAALVSQGAKVEIECFAAIP
ncbi:MAG: RidA family protein [Gemmatimonadota bacterium]|jgi:2-iminobutanoate/2-iminopropanoate deaminase|nr:RidA family protein [Gemmatimonadota bacterium]MDQ8163849.1 RidA family protein [Gemmatimonadota bacterium]